MIYLLLYISLKSPCINTSINKKYVLLSTHIMKIIFTICSNNYLAQAKTLGDSVLRHNPDYTFVIMLCDKKKPAIDYSFYSDFDIIEISEINIPKLDKMSKIYNIVELNTSVKPFCFEYLYQKYNANIVMYFDPDTCVFSNFNYIEEKLQNNDIILTPHILTPIEFDGYYPTENLFTNYGIYNLGFLATKKSENTQTLFKWWQRRLEINCYIRPEEGIFVDQLPMNYAPLFFENVYVSTNMGLNMAPWNLHERKISQKNGVWYVNNEEPLVFYHFSNYNPNTPDTLAKYYNRITFEGHNDLKSLYDGYKEELLKNNYEELSKIECGYRKKTKNKKMPPIKKVLNYIKKYPLFLFKKDFWK